jgi:plasmid stabilization system protein ParE
VKRLRLTPEALVDPTMRRALVRRFPYSIFYEIEPQQIIVYGVFHGARDPDAWKRRRDA